MVRNKRQGLNTFIRMMYINFTMEREAKRLLNFHSNLFALVSGCALERHHSRSLLLNNNKKWRAIILLLPWKYIFVVGAFDIHLKNE
jgi:hypothetical protein